MAQLSEECRIARERIQKLEFEAEALVSKKIETEKLVSELELQIDSLSESSRSSENKRQILLLKISALETENKDNTEKLQAEIQRSGTIDGLLKQGETHEQHVDLMDKQVSQLHSTLEEKEQLIVQYKEREKNLEEQITENLASLTAAEIKLVEDKKHYDLMLESKQLELSRHLKDISQRKTSCLTTLDWHYDKFTWAINDIRKKYEVEKLEIVNMEKQKAEKLVRERAIECEKKLEECREESRQHLMHVQEEHTGAGGEAEALLQLQWKVMSDKPEGSKKRGQRSLRRPEHEKDSPLVGAKQTPVSTLLKKASENINSPTVMNIQSTTKGNS
ncbi:hypothetical protein RchiOBHm_Chr0c28g0500941 [Rosa chinensis]|uniref:Uncharacterized protein n=1 Tax=Rosa chinensis TaxID=74649 RepID=A0A2P6SQC6_ROSCH|nr:hypothetical protein RchiOBHm_Chr0c28g0500941 [Rosa chinensis]